MSGRGGGEGVLCRRNEGTGIRLIDLVLLVGLGWDLEGVRVIGGVGSRIVDKVSPDMALSRLEAH
jgi:hypothetical protein